MVICLCHRVSDRDIARHAASGCDFDELQEATRVATACGSCYDCAVQTLEAHRSTCGGSAACGTARARAEHREVALHA